MPTPEPLRSATIADIVRRLTAAAAHYAETAVTALGWGMGPAQYGITEAVDAAEAAGLITTRTWRGKRFARIAEQPLRVGPYTIALIVLPKGAHFAYGVDVHRPATEDDSLIYDIPQGTLVLADQWGGHDLDETVDRLPRHDRRVHGHRRLTA